MKQPNFPDTKTLFTYPRAGTLLVDFSTPRIRFLEYDGYNFPENEDVHTYRITCKEPKRTSMQFTVLNRLGNQAYKR